MRLWLLLILGLGLPAWAQISPGTLSHAHTDLSSPAKCGTCHIFGAGAPRFRCLSCHAEIRHRIAEKRGFHARVVKNTGGLEDCARCHTEHYGKDFNIVKWETSAAEFDHRQTGYPLVGKHAGLTCARCHNQQNVLKGERAGIQVKDLNHTYLGLSESCTTCHTDQHRGQLGNDCQRCHNMEAWKPASGFDHSTTKYPLTGLHARVTCAQCHKPRTEDAKVFVPYEIPFSTCTDCHNDPHRGAFTAPCQSCHVTEGWKLVHTSTSTFDHDKTKFPLHGAHGKLMCESCHKTSNFAAPIAHEQCADCHTPDPHKGQFPGKDCGLCHNDDAFKPSLFTVTLHQKSAYPLVGKHAAVECAKCHPPAGKDTVYKVVHNVCMDCHKDAHGGQFQNAKYANKCESCHTLDGFRPSTFTLVKHQDTQFPLKGGHAATACADCHKGDSFENVSTAKYHFTSMVCTTCHEDPHRGDAASNAKRGCETCHNVRTWKDTAAFDHATTKFELLGAHRSVGCLECHRPVTTQGPKTIPFKDTPVVCSGCHEDIHGGQFIRDGVLPDCTTCHNLVAWKPAMFDHEKQANFSLKGAHERVPCGDCHTQTAILAGHEVVVFKNALKRCIDCHAAQ
jgi:predicted CXXCH cytochrome family protein